MKSPLSALLAFSIAFSPLAQAGELRLVRTPEEAVAITQRGIVAKLPPALRSLRGIPGAKESVSNVIQTSEQNGLADEVFGEVGQSTVFLITMVAVDLIGKQVAASFKDRKIDDATLASIAFKSVQNVLWGMVKFVDDNSTWASIGGSTAAAVTTSRSLKLLRELIVNPTTRPKLLFFFQNSAIASAAFLGYDFPAQLVTEARNLISDPDEYKRSGSLIHTGAGALASLIYSDPDLDMDRKVMGDLMVNVFTVAILNGDLRSEWLSNTWRTRIMSGEFMTILGTALAAGAVASVVPGVGTALGVMFGVGIGVGSMMLPQNFKDQITFKLQDLRNQVNSTNIAANNSSLLAALEKIRPATPMLIPLNIINHWLKMSDTESTQTFKRALARRHDLRDNEVTIVLERQRLILTRLFNSQINVASASTDLEKTYTTLNEIYDREKADFTALLGHADVNTTLHTLISDELDRIAYFKSYFEQLKIPLLSGLELAAEPVKKENLGQETQSVVDGIQVGYSRGFSESSLLNQ